MDTNNWDYLCEKAKGLLGLSDTERIAALYESRWIGYPGALDALRRIDQLFNRPRVPRMRNLVIIGDSNNGKSEILTRFGRQHPRVDNPENEHALVPVMLVQTPPSAEENRLYESILKELGSPFKSKDGPGQKFFQVFTLCTTVGTRILFLDELHNALGGNFNAQRKFCNVIRYIGNELKVSIVAAGISDAFNVIQSDSQLANRFDSVILPKWKLGGDYSRLLTSFERVLPLRRQSNLAEKEISIKLLSMSEGLIGELSMILNQAAEMAITSKHERIDLDILKRMSWQQPSDRTPRLSKR